MLCREQRSRKRLAGSSSLNLPLRKGGSSGKRVPNAGPKNPLNPIGSLAAKETTMKVFLQNVFATLRKTNAAKSPRRPERPSTTPALGVRSQVKAGVSSFQWGIGR